MQFAPDCRTGVQQEVLPGASVLAPRPHHFPSQQRCLQGAQHTDISFHQRLHLFGRFSVVVASSSTRSLDHAYTAHVFDKGTIFTPLRPDDTVTTLAAHLERPGTGTRLVDAHFTKGDRNHTAYDQVKIDLGRGRLCAVQKPGTAQEALYLVHQSAQFFLQTTAISHVLKFVAKRSVVPWIRQAKIVKDFRAGREQSEDFEQLLRLCKQVSVQATTTPGFVSLAQFSRYRKRFVVAILIGNQPELNVFNNFLPGSLRRKR